MGRIARWSPSLCYNEKEAQARQRPGRHSARYHPPILFSRQPPPQLPSCICRGWGIPKQNLRRTMDRGLCIKPHAISHASRGRVPLSLHVVSPCMWLNPLPLPPQVQKCQPSVPVLAQRLHVTRKSLTSYSARGAVPQQRRIGRSCAHHACLALAPRPKRTRRLLHNLGVGLPVPTS